MPYATKAVTKAVPALATGAMSALGSLGIDKIFGKGQTGGFLIPQDKIDKLIAHKNLLTKKQKKQILNSLQTGGQIIIKPTKTQQGGFLGTLLASIGIPLLVNALTGKGLQVDRQRSKRSLPVYVPPPPKSKGGLINPYMLQPPPFLGTWEQMKNPVGMGLPTPKKSPQKTQREKRQGTAIRPQFTIQLNPINRSNSIKFINKALSNIDLMNWINKLKIKHFRDIYSRDNLPDKILKKECGIINLDSLIGPETHWVCYRNIDKYCEYFDPFGLIMPKEIQFYLSTSGKLILYSGDEIQERDSVLCGYWCLYYLNERQKGKSILKTIHNPLLSMTDQYVNHRFIIHYLKNIMQLILYRRMVKSYCVKQKADRVYGAIWL